MKKFSIVLFGLGAFLLTGALLARFYAYERLAVMPADAEINAVASTAPGQDATYFDIGSLSERTGPLTNRTRVLGDVAAAQEAADQAGGPAVVWAAYSCTAPSDTDCTKDPSNMLAGAIDVTAFSAHGSEVVDWDGAYRETGGKRDDNPVVSGHVFKLPFGVEKRDYTWWNGDLAESYKLTYEGTTEVDGLEVYKFVQDVPDTVVGTIDLPGSLVSSEAPSVTGDIHYEGHLEMTIEPESGVSITTTSSPRKWVEVDGRQVLTMVDATLSLTDETVADNVETYRSLSLMLTAVRLWFPIGGAAAGLALIALGALLRRRSARRGGLPGVELLTSDDPRRTVSV